MFPFYENHHNKDHVRKIEVTNFIFPNHLHQEIEIVYVVEGTCCLTIEQEPYSLTQGMLAIIFPHCVHQYHHAKDYKADIFILDTVFLSEYEYFFTSFLPESPIVEKNSEVQAYLTKVMHNHSTSSFQELVLRKAVWKMIFALSIQEMTFRKRERNNASLVYQILLYINQNYKKPLTLQKVAEDVGCSVFTISKVFSEKIEMSFPDYLAHLRISFAKQLLETTNDSILDIALQSGFENQRSFNRHFKNQTHQTPRDYRHSNAIRA